MPAPEEPPVAVTIPPEIVILEPDAPSPPPMPAAQKPPIAVIFPPEIVISEPEP